MIEIQPWMKILEQDNCRVTGPRKVIAELLMGTERALSPVEIFDFAREKYPKMGLVTVYRTLEKLEELHLIQRVHQPGSCNAFLPRAIGHQHLIICEKCGKANFFEGDDLDGFFRKVAERLGYSVTDHWLQLFGICPKCASVH